MGASEKDFAQRRLGGGKLYISEYDSTGNLKPEEWFGITENLVQSVEHDYVTIPNTEGCTILDDAKILSKTTVTLKWDTKNVSPINLARAFLGTVNETVTAAGSASGEVHSNVTLDEAFALNYKFASNIVVKNSDDSTTYVQDTDYTVDTTVEPNTITPLSSGSIATGSELHVSYDYAGYTDGLIKAMSLSSLDAQLRFKMCNSQGHDYNLTYNKASISSAGDFHLKAVEDAGIISFTATVVKVGDKPLFQVEYTDKNA